MIVSSEIEALGEGFSVLMGDLGGGMVFSIDQNPTVGFSVVMGDLRGGMVFSIHQNQAEEEEE